jgi:hypothetical protein
MLLRKGIVAYIDNLPEYATLAVNPLVDQDPESNFFLVMLNMSSYIGGKDLSHGFRFVRSKLRDVSPNLYGAFFQILTAENGMYERHV